MSEAWALRVALGGQRYETLELDPFTLSTFDARNLLDFIQQDAFFLSADAIDSLA